MLYKTEMGNFLEQLVGKLKEIRDMQEAILLGLLTRGEHEPDSDVDLAVITGGEDHHEP